jgi:hypothetical protein
VRSPNARSAYVLVFTVRPLRQAVLSACLPPYLTRTPTVAKCAPRIELDKAYELPTNDFDGVLVRSQACDRGCRSGRSGVHSRNSTAATRRSASQLMGHVGSELIPTAGSTPSLLLGLARDSIIKGGASPWAGSTTKSP